MANYNKIRDIRIGLEIFERNGGWSCDAQHDEFRSGQADNKALTQTDIATLQAAKWFVDSDECSGCAKEGEEFFIDAVAASDGSNLDEARHALTCNHWKIFT